MKAGSIFRSAVRTISTEFSYDHPERMLIRRTSFGSRSSIADELGRT